MAASVYNSRNDQHQQPQPWQPVSTIDGMANINSHSHGSQCLQQPEWPASTAPAMAASVYNSQTTSINSRSHGSQCLQLTYRQPAQNGVLTDQLCRAIFCIHLSIMPMQIAITIT